MNINILVLICLILIEEELAISTSNNRDIFFLPMKKDHKYGDDICYYREIDKKLDYAVYYVKPCKKGKYCENNVNNQPFGFCKDIPTTKIDFPNYGDTCTTNAECQNGLICDNTCKRECPSSSTNNPQTPFQHDYDTFDCHGNNYEIIEDKYCSKTDNKFSNTYPQRYQSRTIYYGKFPGLPKECGIIHFEGFTDYESNAIPNSNPIAYNSFTRYLEVSREWCSIGEAKDGDFVDDWRFCKSGFVLPFYPNKDIEYPRHDLQTLSPKNMCVTPTAIDLNNPLFQCVITYKLEDGSEHKYKVSNSAPTSSATGSCNQNIVIRSQLYTEFIDVFNSASEEDKKNCYLIPQGETGNCENIKLLKLYYFYNNINEYLFYKDRKDLEKVLHFKIQQVYHRYYELSRYLNLNYLFFLLILILL